jgi:hypothetical protein
VSARASLQIGGIRFAIQCPESGIIYENDPAYRSFLYPDCTLKVPDIEVTVITSPLPDTSGMRQIFESGQSWSMFRKGGAYFLALNPPALGADAIWIAKFGDNPTAVTIYCSEAMISATGLEKAVVNPLKYPLDQLLLMYALAEREGALIHAAGVNIHGKGYVFPGRSGAGKSTLVKQCDGLPGIEVLSDDRIVVRKTGEGFKMYGTPWPGEAGAAINKDIPLKALFFLSQSDDNCIKPLQAAEAVSKLLPVLSVPWYDGDTTAKILEFCDRLVSGIPAYELKFRPGKEVAELLSGFSPSLSRK